MPSQYPALEWLQRRSEGEPVNQIARAAGVPTSVIRRATDPYGPFPEPRTPRQASVAARAARWISLRKQGIPVAQIAAAWNVPHQQVSRLTRDAGPYPRPGPTRDQVRAWVAARRAGTSIAMIAAEHHVNPEAVRKATHPHGPFPIRYQRTPDGLYCRTDIASLVRLSYTAILAWDRAGHLPQPDFITARGRRLWLAATIDNWLPTAGLAECEVCGAFARTLAHHQTAHRKH